MCNMDSYPGEGYTAYLVFTTTHRPYQIPQLYLSQVFTLIDVLYRTRACTSLQHVRTCTLALVHWTCHARYVRVHVHVHVHATGVVIHYVWVIVWVPDPQCTREASLCCYAQSANMGSWMLTGLPIWATTRLRLACVGHCFICSLSIAIRLHACTCTCTCV